MKQSLWTEKDAVKSPSQATLNRFSKRGVIALNLSGIYIHHGLMSHTGATCDLGGPDNDLQIILAPNRALNRKIDPIQSL